MKNIVPFLSMVYFLQSGALGDDHLAYGIPDNAEIYGPIVLNDEMEVVRYHREGSPIEEEKGRIAIEIYSEGVLIERELLKELRLHGIQRRWYSDGALRSESPYREGKMEGLFRVWDRLGNLIGHSEIRDGNGIRVEFGSDGVLKLIERLSDGRLEGYRILAHPQHSGFTVSFFQGGRVTGFHLKVFDGQLECFTHFSESGTRHGPEGLITAGETPEIEFFINGVRVSEDGYSSQASEHGLPYSQNGDYSQLVLTPEVLALLNEIENLPKARIPLELTDDGEIKSEEGEPLVLPDAFSGI